jgi:hypothetical protein
MNVKNKNMKKSILFFIAFGLSGFLFAQGNATAIGTAARTIISAKSQHTAFSDRNYQVNRTTLIQDEDDNPLFWVVDLEPTGFVILSGEKFVYPLIAYSFDNSYPHEIDAHNFNSWMKGVEKQIIETREAKIPADKIIRDAWNNLDNPEYWRSDMVKSASPMLQTEWNQGKYYNTSCPEDPAGPDDHVLTGCVATALGQLMNYFRHPSEGTGYYGYTDPNYGFLEMDFSQQTYNWDAMGVSLDFYNQDVADLLYHIGVSVDMQYGPDASGMYNHKGAYTLRTYFGYDSNTEYLFRDSLDESFDWPGMLIDHLDQKIPLYYAGWSDTVFQSGHAFIVDGYQDSTYFHFNWGWGGSADGYFNLNSLTPSGSDFTQVHEAIANAAPATNNPEPCTAHKILVNKQGCLEDGSGPLYNYDNNQECEWLIQPDDSVAYIKFDLLSFNTQPEDELIIYDGPDDTAPVLESFSGDISPQSFESTADNVLVKFITDGTETNEGWLLAYDTESPDYCSISETLTDSTNLISDGSNSYLYNQNTFCNWNIQPQGADSVSIQFLEFDVADGDYVRVMDANSNQIIADFNGNTVPEPFSVQSDNITITFRSYNNRAQGWKLKYAMNTMLLKENTEFDHAALYPNPAGKQCFFEFYNRNDKTLQIKISDTRGKLIYDNTFAIYRGSNRLIIPVNKIQTGLYFVNLTTENKHEVRKLIIK